MRSRQFFVVMESAMGCLLAAAPSPEPLSLAVGDPWDAQRGEERRARDRARLQGSCDYFE
jgi:hypothetical protein